MRHPELPPEHARHPDMLAWRLDWQQSQIDGLEERISTLESLPSSSDTGPALPSLPAWLPQVAAGLLVLLGLSGHAPWAIPLAGKLLGF